MAGRHRPTPIVNLGMVFLLLLWPVLGAGQTTAPADIRPYVDFLEKTPQDGVSYVLELFRAHDMVLVVLSSVKPASLG